MFFDVKIFPWFMPFEEHWPSILEEFNRLLPEDLIVWPENLTLHGTWEVFGLHAGNRWFEQNVAKCPKTSELLRSVPGLNLAGFSIMRGGTHIRPHVGYSKAVLRAHLGLIIPPSCGIRVGPETREWTAGKLLVFDDTVSHEAWNQSSQDRVVLLADFQRPDGR